MFQQQKKEHSWPLIIISSFIIFYTLSIGKELIVPFVISILISFSLIGTSNFFQKFKINKFFSMLLSILLYLLIFYLFGQAISYNIDIKELKEIKLPEYQKEIKLLIKDTFSFLNIPLPEKLSQILDKKQISTLFTFLAGEVALIISNAGMIFFYTLFLILEFRYIGDKLVLIFSDNEKRKNINEIIEKIKTDTKAYFIIKTIVSLITAALSYIIMISFQLDLAILWASLIFLLNYIPNIGSVIALFFPMLIAFIQKDILSATIIISLLISIQIFMGNIVEPKFMGNKLNLSPLIIILALSFWGAIWGIVGMLLSVPIMVIINIILSKIPSTRPIAIMLSEKGELKIETVEEITKTRKKMIHKIKNKILK